MIIIFTYFSRRYLKSFDNDHLGVLSAMTSYKAPKNTSFDVFWVVLFTLFCSVALIGTLSIGIKKIVEKRKDGKLLEFVLGIAPSRDGKKMSCNKFDILFHN